MNYPIFACLAGLLVMGVIAFVAWVVQSDHRRNKALARDADRVIKALYGSQDESAGKWNDWRAHYRHTAPDYTRMARDHRRAPHRPARVRHSPSPKAAPQEVSREAPPVDHQQFREPDGSDPQ